MLKKAILFTLASIFIMALSACGSPSETSVPSAPQDDAQPAPDIASDPSIPPLPEEWMQLPNSALVYYLPSSYEVEHTNTRVNVQGWVMASSTDDYRDYEDFVEAVNAWYSMQAEAVADFELVDLNFGAYTWGELEIRIEADSGVDGDYEVLFSISEREPINPDEPMG